MTRCRPAARPASVTSTRPWTGSHVIARARPSTLTLRSRGSTPDPRSATASTSGSDARRRSSRTVGGVVSSIQKRKRKRPARARLGVSKTTSYEPAAGRTTPATGSTCWNDSRYGFRSRGRAVWPTRRFSSPAETIRGMTLERLDWPTTATPKFATRLLIRTRETTSGPPCVVPVRAGPAQDAMGLAGEARGLDAEPVRDAAPHRAAGKDDEARQVALGGPRPDGRTDRERARDGDRGRDRHRHPGLLGLLGDGGGPGAGPAAGVGELD